MDARILPVCDDPETGGFWAAARQGELRIRECQSCGAVLHLPRAYCHQCGSWAGRWKRVSGRGQLYSWTTVEHQVHSSYPVPYTIVLVELADAPGTRLVGYLPGSPELRPGQSMEVWFEPLSEAVVLPQWRPA